MAHYTVEQIQANFAALQQSIAQCCARVGRDPAEIRVLPVTKEFPPAIVQLAYEAGYHAVGENKVQELVDKATLLKQDGRYDDLAFILIGHLQSNKARFLANYVAEFHALDSVRLAQRINRFMREADRVLPVYVQVNTSGESSKYGLKPEEVAPFLEGCADLSHLNIVGLMTLAINSPDEDAVRHCFSTLRQLRDTAQQRHPNLTRLSMGMSGDYEIAIEEGATDIRVGQMIFGSRDIPNEMAHYWPENESENGPEDDCEGDEDALTN